MPSEPTRVSIEFTRAFKRHLRALSKKYHHVRSDIQPAIETIQSVSSKAIGFQEPSTLYSKYE